MGTILALGDNTVDYYVREGLCFPGGNAMNVAVLARRCGTRSTYLGNVGNDSQGDFLLDALGSENVERTLVRRYQGRTSRSLIGHRDGERFFIKSDRSLRARYDLRADDYAAIARHDILHTGIDSEIEADLPAIRQKARCLSFDFSTSWSPAVLDRVLPLLDIAFLSLPPHNPPPDETFLRRCLERGPGIIVLTRGADGAMAMDRHGLLQVAARPVAICDTLGAGDGFIAAFLRSRLRNDSLADTLHDAAAFAATVCGWKGAFGHARPFAPEAIGDILPSSF